MNTFIATGCSVLLGTGIAAAGSNPIVDGTMDAAYGPPAAIQNNSTGFGETKSMTQGLGSQHMLIAILFLAEKKLHLPQEK